MSASKSGLALLISITAVSLPALVLVSPLVRGDGDHPPAGTSPPANIPIPLDVRDWTFVSVAHEEGTLNDLRIVLANSNGIKAYRQGASSFSDGVVIARYAWKYVKSPENNKVFGPEQSFVPGEPTEAYLQLMVKDSKKYASTGGWGFAQFDASGSPADSAHLASCFPCHKRGDTADLVFTHYAP